MLPLRTTSLVVYLLFSIKW